jgi:excisionase family DNA binding protein
MNTQSNGVTLLPSEEVERLQSRLLKIEEAAHRTSTHKNYIWGLIKSGKLPAVRIGERIVRVYESDLLKLFSDYKGGEFCVRQKSAIGR